MAAAAVFSGADAREASTAMAAWRHKEWMARHGSMYKDAAEKERRQKMFELNAQHVESLNAGGRKFRVALNNFADMTAEELRSDRRSASSRTAIPPTSSTSTSRNPNFR